MSFYPLAQLATLAILTASTGCTGLSFPSLPTFSLLDSDSVEETPYGVPALPSRPDGFSYGDASTRTQIRFARNSFLLEDGSVQTLRPLADALVRDSGARLLITGFASRGAAPGADRVLGEQRALTIRDTLISFGAPAAVLHTVSFGSDRPPAGASTATDQVDISLFSAFGSEELAPPPP